MVPILNHTLIHDLCIHHRLAIGRLAWLCQSRSLRTRHVEGNGDIARVVMFHTWVVETRGLEQKFDGIRPSSLGPPYKCLSHSTQGHYHSAMSMLGYPGLYICIPVNHLADRVPHLTTFFFIIRMESLSDSPRRDSLED